MLLLITAAVFSCSTPEWVGSPHMNGKVLEASMSSRCQIDLVAPGSISSLNAHMNDLIPTLFETHVGPTPADFEGIHGMSYETTRNSNGATFNETVLVGVDKEIEHFVYKTDTTSINGSGNAAYLRSFHHRKDVVPTSATSFTLDIVESIEIAKPWFAPEGVFISQASAKIKEQFTKELNDQATQVAHALLD